jgi:hypothetical protein
MRVRFFVVYFGKVCTLRGEKMENSFMTYSEDGRILRRVDGKPNLSKDTYVRYPDGRIGFVVDFNYAGDQGIIIEIPFVEPETVPDGTEIVELEYVNPKN